MQAAGSLQPLGSSQLFIAPLDTTVHLHKSFTLRTTDREEAIQRLDHAVSSSAKKTDESSYRTDNVDTPATISHEVQPDPPLQYPSLQGDVGPSGESTIRSQYYYSDLQHENAPAKDSTTHSTRLDPNALASHLNSELQIPPLLQPLLHTVRQPSVHRNPSPHPQSTVRSKAEPEHQPDAQARPASELTQSFHATNNYVSQPGSYTHLDQKEEPELRMCSKCKINKPFPVGFHRSGVSRSGVPTYRPDCIPCHRALDRAAKRKKRAALRGPEGSEERNTERRSSGAEDLTSQVAASLSSYSAPTFVPPSFAVSSDDRPDKRSACDMASHPAVELLEAKRACAPAVIHGYAVTN